MSDKSIAPISVVIPCYNCANTIVRAVDSIIKQSLPPYEIILVNDNSTDDTLNVLDFIKSNFTSHIIKILNLEKNQGASNARNVGWTIASQPYIAFLDADDSWHSRKIEIQYNYLNQHPSIDICGHLCFVEKSNLTEVNDSFKTTSITKFSLLYKNSFSTPTVMLRRDLGFRFAEDKRYAEDYFLWQQAAQSGASIVRLEVPLTYLHKAPYGASGLSADLWKMEKEELKNFVYFYKRKEITLAFYLFVSCFSFIKYMKRVLVTVFFRLHA